MNPMIELYVVFAPNMKHCYTIARHGRDGAEGFDWVVTEYGFSRVQTRVYNGDDIYNPYELMVDEGSAFLRCHPFDTQGTKRFNILSCVGLVKAQLGIDKWWIVTPYQLYRYLVKKGASRGSAV